MSSASDIRPKPQVGSTLKGRGERHVVAGRPRVEESRREKPQETVITFGCTPLAAVLLLCKARSTRVCCGGRAGGMAEGQLVNVKGDAWELP